LPKAEEGGLLLALCAIRGMPPNFRSQRTSCRTEANAGTGEDDRGRVKTRFSTKNGLAQSEFLRFAGV